MSVIKLLAVLCVVTTAVMAAGEYETPPIGSADKTRFDIPPSNEGAMPGGRDESRDPSAWIMNLASTRNPPWKRYRRPTTSAPKAMAQEDNDDVMGLSVSPE